MITLIDDNTQYFKLKVGTSASQNARNETFCQYLLAGAELLVVPDARADPKFAGLPLVTGSPHIRLYAGAALITHDGYRLGSLCIMDSEPGNLSLAQQHLLQAMAKRVVQIMEFDFSVQILKQQFLQGRKDEITLRSFFDSSGACHLLIGKEMEIIAFNRNMADFFERIYHIQLCPGMAVSQVFIGEQLSQFLTGYQVAIEGIPVKYERAFKYGDDLIWWSVAFEPGFNPEGEIIGISYNATDVTERKLHEEQLLARNESLRKIAYIQSHEVRRPVASILGLMELFRLNDYETTVGELKMMEQATLELDQKIRDIVNYTS
jgi:PAS domain S-box-containing protein